MKTSSFFRVPTKMSKADPATKAAQAPMSFEACLVLVTTLLLLLFVNVVAAVPCHAQYGVGLLSGLQFSTAQRVSGALRAYFKEHGKFPQSTIGLDSALTFIYTAINGTAPDPAMQITSSENYRDLGFLRMTTDASIDFASLDAWKHNPPTAWSAPANTVVILTDGQNRFLIWCAGMNEQPIRDTNNLCMFIIGTLSEPTSTPMTPSTPSTPPIAPAPLTPSTNPIPSTPPIAPPDIN